MHEITRRDVLKRIGGTVPALVLWEIVCAPGEAGAQQSDLPEPVLADFIKLSVVLTGYEASQLNPRLAREYYHRIDRHLTSVGHEGALLKLVQRFGALGTPGGPITAQQEKLVQDLMSNPKYQCPDAKPTPLPLLPNPNHREAIRLINESRELINRWTKDPVNPFGCDPAKVVEDISVEACSAPDWTKQDVDPYICQEITAVWYMSAIYRVTPGMFNVVDHKVVPFDEFHYGSAEGYVSGLIWDTVGGHTHPYGQCGGEFGYWQKNPQPEKT